jgi:hypothetical protein
MKIRDLGVEDSSPEILISNFVPLLELKTDIFRKLSKAKRLGILLRQ